jgi:hypothetical protein
MFAVLDWTNDPWLWLWWIVPLTAALAAIVALVIVVVLTQGARRERQSG